MKPTEMPNAAGSFNHRASGADGAAAKLVAFRCML